MRGATILITATPATTPLVYPDWIQPGTHITAVGSDNPSKRQLAARVITQADVVAVDDLDQARRLGELKNIDLADLHNPPVTLGQILVGAAASRTDPVQITIADLTGIGAQDATMADLVVRKLLG